MNKKILAVAIAGALSAPSAFAATDTSGMQFTSASEGFYASIRLRFNSGGHDDSGANIENSSSRIGVRGSNDLGGGLEGFYQWELGVNTENGSSAGSTRLAHVGLRGGWGQLMVGSGWTEAYNMTYGSTDIANHHSGSLVYNTLAPGRASKMIQYTSPDLSGFQGAIAVLVSNSNAQTPQTYHIGANGQVYPTAAAAVAAGTTVVATLNGTIGGAKDDNDLDQYLLSAKYEVQGFTAAIAYSNVIEYDGDEDWTGLAYRLGYAQDNWYVTGWYGKDNTSDLGNAEDIERLSLAGGVEVGKVNLYAVYEASEEKPAAAKVEDEYTTVGVQYNLGANSRVWVEYAGEDLDSNSNTGDFISIGMQHNF